MLQQDLTDTLSDVVVLDNQNVEQLISTDIVTKKGPIIAVCTDSSRCGSAIYTDAVIQLVSDRKDSGEPYKGLDIVIMRAAPEVVIISVVQKKLIDFLEKRFKFRLFDISRRFGYSHKRPIADLTTTSTTALSIQAPLSQESQTTTARRCTAPVSWQPFSDSNHVPDESADFNFDLYIVPNVWFSVSKGMEKLVESDFVSNKGLTNPEEKLLFLTSRVRKSEDVCAVRAVSAIESFFENSPLIAKSNTTNQVAVAQQIAVQERPNDASGTNVNNNNNLMPIVDVRYIDPGPVVSIDRATFKSLGIMFAKTSSKSSINLDPETQGIVSLYDILNQCQSPEGQKQLRTIMMWPLQDFNEISRRHETVEFFTNPENRLFKDQLCQQLKNVIPMSILLSKLSQSVASYRELAKLYKALWSFIAIIDLIRGNRSNEISLLQQIVNQDSPEMRAAIDSIMSAIDFESSKQERRIQVLEGISQEVDEKKELIRNLAKFCDGVAVQETSKYRDVLSKTCRVIYLPRIGFLCGVDFTSTSELLSIKSNSEFDVLMHTEKSVYFKTKRMESLDSNAGDVACDLIDIQEGVIMDLQNELLKYSESILCLTELCGQLDCLITFATVSSQRGYKKPEFTTSDEEILIEQAYHPLHYRSQTLVPNDIHFYKDSVERKVKVMVITGPNSCGKTTYMKTACLVVYMAHIGCFVPAKRAKLPLIDAILTRLHSPNSISTGLSSFATDLHQINYAINRATERSLIIIDEFGKGTRARDGFHLLKSLVIYFAVRGQLGPYTMISTHYSRLVDHLQVQSEYISYKTFKVTRDQAKDNIVYEYKLIDGVGEDSLADKVAAKAGVPAVIIDRAKQIRNYITEGVPIRPKPPSAA